MDQQQPGGPGAGGAQQQGEAAAIGLGQPQQVQPVQPVQPVQQQQQQQQAVPMPMASVMGQGQEQQQQQQQPHPAADHPMDASSSACPVGGDLGCVSGVERLVRRSGVEFSPEVLQCQPDLRLISTDGHVIELASACLLALAPNWAGPLWEPFLSGSPSHITSELTSDQLETFVRFAVTGVLLHENYDEEVFRTFGVDLSKLPLTRDVLSEEEAAFAVKRWKAGEVIPSPKKKLKRKATSSLSDFLPPKQEPTDDGSASKPSSDQHFLDSLWARDADYEDFDDEDDDGEGGVDEDDADDEDYEYDADYMPDEREERGYIGSYGGSTGGSGSERDPGGAGIDSYLKTEVKELEGHDEDEDYRPPPRRKKRKREKNRSFKMAQIVDAEGNTVPPEQQQQQQQQADEAEDDDDEDLDPTVFQPSSKDLIPEGLRPWQYYDTSVRRNPKLSFQCDDCSFGSNSHVVITQHIHYHKDADRMMPGLPFSCIMCGRRVGEEHELIRHYKDLHDDKIYKCPKCAKRFKRSDYKVFLKHIKVHDKVTPPLPREYQKRGTGKYKCAHCGLRVSTISSHLSYWGKFHRNKCVQCDFLFESFEEHAAHVRVAHEDVWRYVCGICPAIFVTLEERDRHRSDTHHEEWKKICHLCGKRFKMLQVHQEDVHGPARLQCPKCPRIFRHPNSLRRHMPDHKNDGASQENTMCSDCGKKFPTVRSLNLHRNNMHTVDELKPFRCEVCARGFGTASMLRKHSYVHNDERQFACDECGKMYKRSVDLISHKNKVHVPLMFPCPICDKSFKTRKNQRNHVLSLHTPESEKPYQCQYCSKGFATAHHLREHEKNTHAANKPSSCNICGVGFSSKAVRDAHMKDAHHGIGIMA